MVNAKTSTPLFERINLIEQIELIRNQLVRLAGEKGSLTHPSVVLLSQELDYYILQSQLEKQKKMGRSPYRTPHS